MKQIFTLCLALMSASAIAQWPSLPYNPDENGDGLIGVVDLAALLAQYNTEFASAVVSEDGESAIVYMGDMPYPVCATSCKSLPGVWRVPDFEDIGLVWDEMLVNDRYSWLDYNYQGVNSFSSTNSYFPYVHGSANPLNVNIKYSTTPGSSSYRCYCASKQMPRVEYCYCSADGGITNTPGVSSQAAAFQSCCDEKVQDGWYPLGGLSKGTTSDGGQSFWRWAE